MPQSKGTKPVRVFFTPSTVRVLLATSAIVVFAAAIYLFSGMPAPREQDRVVAGTGAFSIIKPHGWDSKIVYGPAQKEYLATIDLRPGKTLDVVDQLRVAKMREAPDLEKLRSAEFNLSQFQGAPAQIKVTQLKREFIWRAMFERQGSWYEILLVLRQPVEVANSDWWKYLNTFQANPQASIPAASAPASLPTL